MTPIVHSPIIAPPHTMRAALLYAPMDVRFEEAEVPTLASGEMLVQVDAALTCGTDVKCYRRGHPVLIKQYPSAFGHEFAGTVVALADEPASTHLSRFDIGSRVVAANSAPCFECFFCRKGQTNLCENLDLLNGAYAQYIKIPKQIARYNTYLLPDHLPAEQAAFTEPLSVCLRCIELSGIVSGTRVAIIGLGAIGQMLVRLAKHQGAHVTALGRNPLKLALAESFGQADAVVDVSTAIDATGYQVLKKQYSPRGYGFDVVIEAVGQPALWEKSFELVRRGGTVSLFGGCESGSKVSLDTRQLHYDEIRVLSLFHHTPHYVQKALGLLASGAIDPSPLVSEQVTLEQVPEALEKVSAGQALKICVRPSFT